MMLRLGAQVNNINNCLVINVSLTQVLILIVQQANQY